MSATDPKPNAVFDKLRGEPVAGLGTSGYLDADDGTKLFYEYWTPKDRPVNKVLIALHGMAAHSRYLCVLADTLVPHGVAVAVMDYRCHGLSGDKPGDIKNIDVLMGDVRKFCLFVRDMFPDVPIFTLGESMGGAVNVNLNIDPPVKISGMILYAPAIASAMKFSFAQVALLPVMLFCMAFTPGARVLKVTGNEADGMRSPLNIEYDQTDPLHLKYVSVRFLLQLKKIIDRGKKNGPAAISVPALIFQGGKDVAVSPAATKQFYETLSSTDKTFKFYDDAPHCMINDPEIAPELRTMTRDWILAH